MTHASLVARRSVLRAAAFALVAPLASKRAGALAPACGGGLVYVATVAEGAGSGIAAVRFDERTGALCRLPSVTPAGVPTWVMACPDRPLLFASNEHSGAQAPGVSSFHVDPATGTLRRASQAMTGGVAATHLSLDLRSRTIFVAHWESGQVSAVPFDLDGTLHDAVSVVQDFGTGADPGRSHPRSHATVLDPSGRFLLVADFGVDRLFVYRFDAITRALAPADPPFVQLPSGSGPRHLVFHPNGRFVYLVQQVSSTVTVLRWDAASGRTTEVQSVSTRAAGGVASNAAAEIGVSPDGRHLYVSNRGEDSLVLYAVDPATGRISERQRIGSGGKTPRAFALTPSGRWMLVANQDSNALHVFARNPQSGELAATDNRVSVDLPAGLAFVT